MPKVSQKSPSSRRSDPVVEMIFQDITQSSFHFRSFFVLSFCPKRTAVILSTHAYGLLQNFPEFTLVGTAPL